MSRTFVGDTQGCCRIVRTKLSSIACELNVIEQATHVCQTTVVGAAWERGQPREVHGLIYGLHDGCLREVGFSAAKLADVAAAYDSAIHSIRKETRRALIGPAASIR